MFILRTKTGKLNIQLILTKKKSFKFNEINKKIETIRRQVKNPLKINFSMLLNLKKSLKQIINHMQI